MKIVSVRDRRLKVLLRNPHATVVKGLTPFETRRIAEMLIAIQVMQHPLELRAFVEWKAHELTPGRPGFWSLTVRANYRVTFKVSIAAQEASLLDYEDYH